ncbi:inositol monophosphatase family protein [Ruania halotolerans]|uniref:inositol monophosphatase family protein n=1 Tax=Ruania halotolerans TaxID=2897773 RepID=UPI001E435688|nr:inositol monophosphatase [Ruania halotolerans]UFU07229.1 inositol monophosphatase [Ruania halotolerans]
MDTAALLDLLKETAATVITPRFRALASEEVFEKSPGDLVTVADRESEVVITDALRAAYPEALILGEEATAADPSLLDAFATAEHSFTIDPVDGTKNFVNGSPDHAVMVSELRGSEVVRAVIWQPEHEVSWVAERGAGAYRNGERLAALTRDPDPAQVRGATSTILSTSAAPADLPPMQESWWCAGVDYPQLVIGTVDYLVYRRDWPWDHAPGSLLVTETGGHLSRLDGGPYEPRVVAGWLLAGGSQEIVDVVRPPIARTLASHE